MPADILQAVVETLRFFANIKDSVEGMAVTGSTALAAAKMSGYLIQKGAKSLSVLVTSAKKKPNGRKPARSKPEALTLSKKHVAIVLDINNRIVANVDTFLKSKKIDADMIVITNDPSYSDEIGQLDIEKPEEWADLARDFKTHSQKIKRLVGDAKVHIFLAVPVPLAFGLGAVWGTVDDAVVYHWQNKTYHPVMEVGRGLRFKK